MKKLTLDLSPFDETIGERVEALLKRIQDAIKNSPRGEYTHQIISFSLLEISQITNKSVADAIIRKLNLTKKYGIKESTLSDSKEVK